MITTMMGTQATAYLWKPASVMAIAEISSPLTTPGSQRRFCSSVLSELM